MDSNRNNGRGRNTGNVVTKSKDGTAEETCISCMDTIKELDALKLTCQSSHTLCGECSAVYSESTLAQGIEGILPFLKCSICRGQISSTLFERTLKPEQMSTYLTFVAIGTLGDGERLLSCVSCKYSEVHLDDPPLFFCRNELCGLVHCVECKTAFPALDGDEAEDNEDDTAFFLEQARREKHLMCHALRKEKVKFDDAMAKGNGMACPGPNCGIIGRKDGMCTHMTCNSCQTIWCYLCGLSVDQCDKSPRPSGISIYGHNQDWQTNPARCPMYISDLGEVDEEWDLVHEVADNDEEFDQEELELACLEKFHKWLALKQLNVRKSALTFCCCCRQTKTMYLNFVLLYCFYAFYVRL